MKYVVTRKSGAAFVALLLVASTAAPLQVVGATDVTERRPEPDALAPSLLTGGPSSFLKPAPDVAPNSPVEAAIRFRENFGFRSDRAFVGRVALDPTASSEEFGFPLLPAEREAMERKIELQGQLQQVDAFEEANRGTLGGTWLDHRSARAPSEAFTLVVAVTADAESVREAVAQLVPQGVGVDVRTVRYTEQALDSLQERINNDREFQASLGIDVYYIGTNVVRNLVEIGISRPDEAAAEALATRYGPDMVEIFVIAPPELDACTRSNCGPPWKGGLKIYNDASPVGYCTSGFVAVSGTGNKYQWTAGHCGGTRWNHNGIFMGAVKQNTFIQNSPADSQALDIADVDASNIIVTGSATCNPCFTRSITSRQLRTADRVGQTACMSGFASGSSCGVIKSTNTTFTYTDFGVTLVRQRVADYTRNPGDSGGPVFAGNMAMGSHVHFQSDTGWAVYSQVNEIELATGQNVWFGQ